MRRLLFALGVLTAVAIGAPRSADAGFFVSRYPRVGVIAATPFGAYPVYAPPCYSPPYHYPYYAPPVVVYSPAYSYPRPLPYDYDYGRRVVGYTFPGRR
jgi:hypothetical protein